MAEREIDVLHLSTPMGTGGALRLQLNCGELYQLGHGMNPYLYNNQDVSSLEHVDKKEKEWRERKMLTILGHKKHGRVDYVSTLGDARFCLCPRGVAGWAPRVFDAIGMGCIPVLITDYTIFPFESLLDYTKFAVFVRESEVPVLQDILRGIPLERMEEMQLALKIVRTSFLYDPSLPLMGPHTPIDLVLRSLTLQMMRGDQNNIVN